MSLELKRRFKQNLQSIPVYIEDTSLNSDGYFGIKEFPSFFGRGKNGIRVKPSRITLKPKSQLYIEILDVNNNPIYYEIPQYELDDLSRYISVWVYGERDDNYNTPNGVGEIIICGIANKTKDGGEIPDRFKNVINVRWRRRISVGRDTRTESPIIFINQQSTPILEVSESLSFYREIPTQGSNQAQIVTETINQNIVYTSDFSGQNVFLNIPSYSWSSINSNLIGSKILFNLQNVVLTPQLTSGEISAGMLVPQNYTASIESLITNKKARVSPPLTSSVTTKTQSLLKTFTLFTTGSFVVQTISTGSATVFSQSVAHITIKDVNPVVGNIDKINVYIKSKATTSTEYQLIGTKLLYEPITGSNPDIYSDAKLNLTQSTHTFLFIPPNKNTANDIKIEYLNSQNDFANYESVVYNHYFKGYNIQISGSVDVTELSASLSTLETNFGVISSSYSVMSSSILISKGGDIGIGTGTTSPAAKLHVSGNALVIGSVRLGDSITVTAQSSFAAGSATTASGFASMTAGVNTSATGPGSVAFGNSTLAIGTASFAVGSNTVANTQASFATGIGTSTQAVGQTVVGQFNKKLDNQKNVFLIGDGLDDTNRHNLFIAVGGKNSNGETSERQIIIDVTNLNSPHNSNFVVSGSSKFIAVGDEETIELTGTTIINGNTIINGSVSIIGGSVDVDGGSY